MTRNRVQEFEIVAQICLEINLDSTKTLSLLISKDSYQSVGKQDIFDDDVRIALAKKRKSTLLLKNAQIYKDTVFSEN